MVESVEYKLVKKIGDIEIRKYPKMILASTTSASNDNEAFGIIADFIFGNNRSEKRISMTAPVITSEKIKMTAPVITSKDEKRYKMSFVMPSNYSLKTLPIPNSKNVFIETQKPRTMAVIRFSGFMGEEKLEKMTNKLLQTLKEKKIRPKSRPFLMRFNPPWTLPFLRRNEIGVYI